MIHGEESHSLYAWHCKHKLPEIIFPGEWEVEDKCSPSVALLERFKSVGLPLVASYELSMSAREGMAYIVKENNNNSEEHTR